MKCHTVLHCEHAKRVSVPPNSERELQLRVNESVPLGGAERAHRIHRDTHMHTESCCAYQVPEQ